MTCQKCYHVYRFKIHDNNVLWIQYLKTFLKIMIRMVITFYSMVIMT